MTKTSTAADTDGATHGVRPHTSALREEQIPLSDEAQQYTTVSTHLGHFSFTRLPFGISASARVFQEFIDEVLRNIPGACAYQDDVIVG